jgi:hypothetical protein
MTRALIVFLCGIFLMSLAPVLYANPMTVADNSTADTDSPDMKDGNGPGNRKWCRENREECRAQREKRCQENPEKCKEKAKKWCDKHPEFCKVIKSI